MTKILGCVAIALGAALAVTPAGAQGINLGGLTGGLLGGGDSSGSGGTTVSVPGVASVTVSTDGGVGVSGSLLGGGGNTVNADLSGVVPEQSGVSVTLPGTGGVLGSSDPTSGLIDTANNTVRGLTGDGGTVDNLLGGNGLPGLGGLIGGGGGGNGGGGSGGGSNGLGGNGGAGGNGRVILANTGGGAAVGAFGSSLACVGPDSRQVLNFAVSQRFAPNSARTWQRASSIQLVPLKLCPAAKRAVARVLRRNPNVVAMQSAAARDPLIAASLGRSRFGADDVLAVQRQGSMLSVFVF